MKKRHLFLALDIAIVIALFRLAGELPFPYPRTLAGFWVHRQWIGRTLASMLWLAGLWFTLYQVRDKAKTLDIPALLSGMVLLLCVVLTYYATTLVLQSKARLVFQIYGAMALLSAAAAFTMLLLMEKSNADSEGFSAASRKVRWSLAVAFAIVAVALICGSMRYRKIIWYSVILAAAWLFVAPLAVFRSK